MIQHTIFAFPTDLGYRFEPSLKSHGGAILSLMTPPSDYYVQGDCTVYPFIRGNWLSTLRPYSVVVFMVGVITRGVVNKVHRGSYSVWSALRVANVQFSLKKDTVREQLCDLGEIFKEGCLEPMRCPVFNKAFEESVIQPVGVEIVMNVIDNLPQYTEAHYDDLIKVSILSGVLKNRS